MKLNLTGRFVLILLVVGLIPLLVLASFSLRATDKIKLESSNKLESGAKNTLEMIERNIFERYGDVQAFATHPLLRADDLATNPATNAKLVEAANTYIKLYGLYDLSIVTDATGKVIAVNTADAVGKPIDTAFLLGRDFSTASWFRDARDGKFIKTDIVGGTVVEDVAQDPDAVKIYGKDCLTVSLSAPITNAKGEFIGVWRNLADFGLIVEAIIQSNWKSFDEAGYHTTEYYLLDKSGLLLAHYHPSDFPDKAIRHDFSELLKRNFADILPSAKAAILPNAAGHGRERDIENDHWNLTGYAKTQGALGYPGLGWALVVQCEEREMNAGAIAADRATYATVGISALLLIVVAIVVARSITRPIQACVSAMDLLAQGDLTSQVTVTRSDELGTLGRSINACIGNLRKLVGSLTESATALTESAHTLNDTAHTQAAAAEETTVQANTVASAGEELSISAKTMATDFQTLTSLLQRFNKAAANAHNFAN